MSKFSTRVGRMRSKKLKEKSLTELRPTIRETKSNVERTSNRRKKRKTPNKQTEGEYRGWKKGNSGSRH